MTNLVPLQKNGSAKATAALRRLLEREKAPAILLGLDYTILASNDAYTRHYGKPVVEGEDTCFRVSHGYPSPCDENGEACPLAAARTSKKRERVFHIHHHKDGPEHVDVELRPLLDDDGIPAAFIEVIRPVAEASAHPRGSFVGRSPAFNNMLAMLSRVAPSDVPVLLLGESGTGKELCAKAVHERSPRREHGFVPVECSGLSATLFESELFGHAKGAFTGAVQAKPGLVEAADGGTLFLDEVGDIPLSLQVKLLRLLESSTYRRVGETTPRHARFRLVCATHRDLAAMVREGTFRRDLYHRIHVFPVDVPALRERRDDIPLLAEAALLPHGKHLTAEAAALLQLFEFDGNIRELRNILERAVILTDDDAIDVMHLPPPPASPAEDAPAAAPHLEHTRHRSDVTWPWGDELVPLDVVEARYLQWAQTTGPSSRSQLAATLGVSERTLYRKLQRLRDT